MGLVSRKMEATSRDVRMLRTALRLGTTGRPEDPAVVWIRGDKMTLRKMPVFARVSLET